MLEAALAWEEAEVELVDGATVLTELIVLAAEVTRVGVRAGPPGFAGVRPDLVRDRKEVDMVAF